MMPTNCENASSSMPGPTTDPQLNQSTALESRSASNNKAVVVGLYGVPGSGKTFLLDQLKRELGQEYFAFYEGSKMIATVVPGGLDAFQKLEEREKVHWRQRKEMRRQRTSCSCRWTFHVLARGGGSWMASVYSK
jgi:hypothetical protein